MKRFTLAILLCLASVAAMAQHATTFNQRLFDAKMAEMAYRLKLTDKQVADFRPVYEQYNKDMIAAWGEPCTQSKTKPQTSNEASAQIKKRMERQKRAQEVRIRYTDRFAAILNAEQMRSSSRWRTVSRSVCMNARLAPVVKALVTVRASRAEDNRFLSLLSVQCFNMYQLNYPI